jgi:hypothetical protein
MSLFESKFTFDEISPITGELCVLIDTDAETGVISRLCMQSGYTNNSLMIDTEDFWKSLSESYTMGYQFAHKDDKGIIWIPSAQATDLAALYPVVDEESKELIWQVAPILYNWNEDDKTYTTEIDFEKTVNFAKLDYSRAFDLFINLSQTDEEE